jgi:hypothetical protein
MYCVRCFKLLVIVAATLLFNVINCLLCLHGCNRNQKCRHAVIEPQNIKFNKHPLNFSGISGRTDKHFGRHLTVYVTCLTLILLTWTKWRSPTNASKWRMGFNSAFKGLKKKTNYKLYRIGHPGLFLLP